jgi:hypothetical protein
MMETICRARLPLASASPDGELMVHSASSRRRNHDSPASNVAGNKSDLTEVLKTLTDLADRLRESEPKSPKKRKWWANSGSLEKVGTRVRRYCDLGSE